MATEDTKAIIRAIEVMTKRLDTSLLYIFLAIMFLSLQTCVLN